MINHLGKEGDVLIRIDIRTKVIKNYLISIDFNLGYLIFSLKKYIYQKTHKFLTFCLFLI
jgi:hypothetical protein